MNDKMEVLGKKSFHFPVSHINILKSGRNTIL